MQGRGEGAVVPHRLPFKVVLHGGGRQGQPRPGTHKAGGHGLHRRGEGGKGGEGEKLSTRELGSVEQEIGRLRDKGM